MRLRPVVLAAVFILGLTYSLHLVRSNTSTAPDYPTRAIGVSEPEVVVDISSGATGYEVAELLFKNKVTKSVSAYFRVAVSNKNSEKVSPGSHRLTLSISAAQALEQLLDPARIPNLIKVFEGAWSEEIVNSLLVYGFKQAEISKAFDSLFLPSGFSNPEGLLFPAQYSFPRQTSAIQVLQAMINRFRSEKFGQEILNASGTYTPLQLLTIASIVQAEGDTADFSKVARVIFNRLEISMPLQMDSTVHYVKKVRGEIFLSTSSTLIDSPYNTYKRYGLPPTPIGNPGARAMEAALNPAVGDWLYFITVAPGDTRFTASHEEFLAWKSLYQENRKAGAFD
ncbi:MAG: endolytic transglycosylase MltG [Candidatus Planktophila sp.]|nr:endolytic transglycosylase MltG [Candidatus Planktophila sp.]